MNILNRTLQVVGVHFRSEEFILTHIIDGEDKWWRKEKQQDMTL